MSNTTWSDRNIMDQTGKTIIITGASSGLGKEAARVLAMKRGTIVMAVRNVQKGDTVDAAIRKEYPEATLIIEHLDLSSLRSVREFSQRIAVRFETVDILINNAGVMACPYSVTEDGFEIQMGTNHFGHFALTGLLLPLLINSPSGRIVATSSVAHRQGNINFDDINWEKRSYKTWDAYSDSKLANLYFAYELSRKLRDLDHAPVVTAAHPGWTATDLQKHSLIFRLMNPLVGQDVARGTLPTLRAATDPMAESGSYYGPSGFLGLAGDPVVTQSNTTSYDTEQAQRLWKLSEDLTNVQFHPIMNPSASTS